MKTERVKFRFRNLFNFRGFRFFESFIENKCIVCELRRTYKNIGICPDCGKRCRNILDRIKRTVRDLDVGGIKCFVDFISFKISCDCGYSGMELLDFCNKHSRHTKRFEERVAIFCRAMTVKDVAEEFQLSWQTVKDIDKNEMRKYIAPLSEAHPERIGIDEIAYEKGHTYLTVVRDIDLRKVIWVGEGRKKEDLNRFFEELGKERSSRIKAAVMDMWDPYIASVKQHTKSDIVFDKFHIAKKVKIRKIYADRHFFSIDMINLFKKLGLTFLLLATENKRVEKLLKISPTPTVITDYLMGDKGKNAIFNLIIVESKIRDKNSGRKDQFIKIAYATNMKINKNDIKLINKIPNLYRRRWGIETSYRVKKGFRAQTTSKNYKVRLMYFLYSVLLYNLWIIIDSIISLGLNGKLIAYHLVTSKIFGTILYMMQMDPGGG